MGTGKVLPNKTKIFRLGKGKVIVLMDIGFEPEKRNIGNYLLETL